MTVIGATAHYVTADLDEGPIIVQEVRPIDHEVTVEQMVHLGHDIEATALRGARAAQWAANGDSLRIVRRGNRPAG